MTFAAIFGEFILGWLFADLLSGAFHWWEDRVPSTDMPLLGKWLIAPNRHHHEEPLAFLKGSFAYRNLATIIFALVVGVIWCALAGPSVFLVATVLGGMATTEVHRYTHEPHRAPAAIKVLQEVGFVQSPKQHSRHHRPPSTRAYCALTDWVNPVLDHFDVWNRFERLLIRLCFRLSLGH